MTRCLSTGDKGLFILTSDAQPRLLFPPLGCDIPPEQAVCRMRIVNFVSPIVAMKKTTLTQISHIARTDSVLHSMYYIVLDSRS
jgi:hypothetical protein